MTVLTRVKTVFEAMWNKLFNETHDSLKVLGVSPTEIREQLEEIRKEQKRSKRDFEDVEYQIQLALEYEEVITIAEKEELERLKLEVKQYLCI